MGGKKTTPKANRINTNGGEDTSTTTTNKHVNKNLVSGHHINSGDPVNKT